MPRQPISPFTSSSISSDSQLSSSWSTVSESEDSQSNTSFSLPLSPSDTVGSSSILDDPTETPEPSHQTKKKARKKKNKNSKEVNGVTDNADPASLVQSPQHTPAPHSDTATRDYKCKQTEREETNTPDEEDPLEEYFVQQARLFRHLEKRFVKFNRKAREEQARARETRQRSKQAKATGNVPARKQNYPPQPRSPQPDLSEQLDDMIGFGAGVLRGASTAGRNVNAALRPAASITRAPSPISSASFSSSSPVDARAHSKLKKKPKRKVNPDAMSVNEAARVLRALETSNPSSSYSLTLSTKVHKSSLPIRGTVSLPLDPRRTSEVILVFAEPNSPSSTLAKQAGAAYVGGEEIFESVLSGKISPTRCLATPGMMPLVSRALARYLGPKGLMPVAKRGLVGEGDELAEKIRGAAGRMEYRADKQGLVRLPVARMDFEILSVENNIRAFIQTIRDDQSSSNTDDAVTAAAQKKKKGSAIVGARLETTNGPSIELNDVL